MEGELPFKTEYAKTGRASCKGCKSSIPQGTLRIAVMVQSRYHDAKQPNWFHESCFFKKQRPRSVGDIGNVENLRMEDQERLQQAISNMVIVVSSTSAKGGKKRSKEENSVLQNFHIEYAKAGRSICCGCRQKIIKGQTRIRKTVFDTEVGMQKGGQELWHHVECFAELRKNLGWFETGEQLPGFKSLSADDKVEVKKTLPAIPIEDVSAAKKPKLEAEHQNEVAEKELTAKITAQQKRLFEFRDGIKDGMKKCDLLLLLEHNKQKPVAGDSEKLLNQVADLLTFGSIAACPECGGHQMLFQKSGYLCNCQLTEWTKCAHVMKEPQRTACLVPPELKEKYEFLNQVRKQPDTRAIRYIPPSTTTATDVVDGTKANNNDGPQVKRARPPLYNLPFAIIGLKDQQKELNKRLAKLSAKCQAKITPNLIAILSTVEEVKRNSTRMKIAKDLGIHIVPVEYLDAMEADDSNAVAAISSMTICDWGTDPTDRILEEDMEVTTKSKNSYTKSIPKSMLLKVKGGTVVDPESGLQGTAHVYIEGKDKYSVVLGLTDIQQNKNSFYKLQLLQSDHSDHLYSVWIFRSWGRIGTTIGGNKLDYHESVLLAKKAFAEIYFDKTGNHFEQRENFVKVPGRMYPIDVHYADDEPQEETTDNNIKSLLHPAVQELIKLIFDINAMKRTMMQFDLDMEKMPLGKLSQQQIQSAYKVLTELCTLIESGGSNARFVDATNRFYTLVPHNFGIESPPLLNTIEQIEKLNQTLDSLMEIECAYQLMQAEDNKKDQNPLDRHYGKLKTKLEPLDKNTAEFKLLQQYLENTHADTHHWYELEIIDIFKVERQGELQRFQTFKQLHNRKLLWHGSRLTNFVGILSHGLKIAPPEAPATGYMFGKGIYFADMVSKSANYCCTNKENSTGLLLLSEVALGEMLKCTSAKCVTKLPVNKHSCLGLGRTMPNPQDTFTREDGVEIPLGKPLTDDKMRCSLWHNEYIVYDVEQVNIQYLFRVKFNYKS